MRRGSWAIACLVGVLAFAGCGKESHPNDPRPATAVEVSIAISARDVSVQPSRVAVTDFGQAIDQNAGAKEPTISDDVPVIVAFTVANLTRAGSKLTIEGPRSYTSNEIIGNGSGTFKVSLPTGTYSVSATGLPGSAAGRFRVGSERSSSSNDLLLP